MIIIFSMIIIILVLIFCSRKNSLSSPVIISGIVWLFTYVFLMIFCFKEINEFGWEYTLFALTYLFFSIGFLIPFNKKNDNSPREKVIKINVGMIKLLIIVQYVLFFVSFYNIRNCFSSINPFVVWNNIRNLEDLPYFYGLSVNIFITLSCLLFAFCLRKKIRKSVFFVSLIPTLFLMIGTSRTIWFTTLIIFYFTFIYVKKNSFLLNVRVLCFLIVFVAAVFIFSSLVKFNNVSEGKSFLEQLYFFSFTYFISPMLAFSKWIITNNEFTYGRNTFRFVYALIGKMNDNIVVSETVMPFINVNGFDTNVYTSLHWYTMDFGIIGMLFLEFLIGIIFKYIYFKHLTKNNIVWTIILAFFVSTIIGQFYAEQLFTQASAWIQRIVCLTFVYKITTKTFIKKNPQFDIKKEIIRYEI